MTTLAEMKKALEAATPGPWYADNRGDEIEIVGKTDNAIRYGVEGEWSVAKIEAEPFEEEVVPAQANARLIVAAVNNLPKLLKVVEAAKDLPYLYDQASADPYDVGYHQVSDEIELLRKALEELNND